MHLFLTFSAALGIARTSSALHSLARKLAAARHNPSKLGFCSRLAQTLYFTNRLKSSKKQVEKLKSEKKVLKQRERSLNGKLSTARAKADKYHNALKKKETSKNHLDLETFHLLMSILDDISTKP